MSKMFQQLGKTTVHIGIGDDKYIEVPMLPVKDLAEFREMQKNFASAKDDKSLTDEQRFEVVLKGRDLMLGLAKKVIPVEMYDNLERMDVVILANLLNVLFTGDDDSASDDPEKKITLPSQVK